MAGALFFICMFLISVGGLLLFRPVQINSIKEYSEPAALEDRKQVTVKMAQFLENNPQIVKQERFTNLPLQANEASNTTPISTPTPFLKVEIVFQGSNMEFNSMVELDQWVYHNTTQDPINFLKQFNENDNPEFYLETLKKVSEIKPTDEVNNHLKQLYLEEAKKMAGYGDGFHQQMMQKALQSYLDLEKDLDLGKKTADEIMQGNR